MNNLYSFDLPQELIAQEPAQPRDAAKLLVYDLQKNQITDSIFRNINEFLPPNTTVVLNNSRVELCRWLFDEGKTELFVLEKLDTNTIRALVRPGKKFKLGDSFAINSWLEVKTVAVDSEGIRTLKLNVSLNDKRLKQHEHIPLPPYIAQNDKLAQDYQTVYAKSSGSLAAPTAGLHFTEDLLADIRKSHAVAELTLHVGLGTFAKLTQENIASGTLHEEGYSIDAKTADVLNAATHITAVGTTTVRTLESVSRNAKHFTETQGVTDIFIRNGFHFKAVDALITNFHLPSTSLLMMVSAFIADKKQFSEAEAAEVLMTLYRHAIQNNYRFYSFGDAMLLV